MEKWYCENRNDSKPIAKECVDDFIEEDKGKDEDSDDDSDDGIVEDARQAGENVETREFEKDKWITKNGYGWVSTSYFFMTKKSSSH